MELVRLYSNPAVSSGQLLRLRCDAQSHSRLALDPPARIPQRVSQRLGPEMIERIVAEYGDGASSTRLTAQYGISKGTCCGYYYVGTELWFADPGQMLIDDVMGIVGCLIFLAVLGRDFDTKFLAQS